MNAIVTKYGVYNVVKNDKGTTDIMKDGKKVCDTEIQWWDKDSLVNAIEEHHELFSLKEEQNKILVTKENAKECVEGLIKVLGTDKESKGFYTSRLKQILNKMK